MGKFGHLYGTAAWQRRRARQLRAEPLCAYCLRRGVLTVATIADHVERHAGDNEAFFQAPLQSLCATCHNAIKRVEEESGYLRGHDVSGWPVDPGHAWNRPDSSAPGGGRALGTNDELDRSARPREAASYFPGPKKPSEGVK